jgi:hypothetical protein
MNLVLTVEEREALLPLLTEQQRTFILENVKRGKKTTFANEMAKDKGLMLPNDASIEDIEMLLDEWVLEDYIDNGFVNPETPCECGRPLRYQYIVKHKSTDEVRRFGITHFEEHTGIAAEIVNAIKKGFSAIDYEMDELLTKIKSNWSLDEANLLIPDGFIFPKEIGKHLDNHVPLLDRHIQHLRKLVSQFRDERAPIHRDVPEVKKELKWDFDSEMEEDDDDQVSFEFDLFEEKETKTSSPTKESLPVNNLSGPIKDKILEYLRTVSSTRVICELLIKNNIVANQRYLTGKPKIYPYVCFFLEGLVYQGELYLEDTNAYEDRFYKFNQ